MHELTDEQKRRAMELMRQYLDAISTPKRAAEAQIDLGLDAARAEVIDGQLKPLLHEYLDGRLPLAELKPKVDGINKRHPHWGFRGIKGQMFFNMAYNVAGDLDEFDAELKAAIAAPTGEEMATSRIQTFSSYVRRIGEQHVEGGGTGYGKPKVGSVPFFLSYFWHVQDRDLWPVYYTNSVNLMTDLNLWQLSEHPGENYIRFKHIHEELARVFTEASGCDFGLYDVEHVLWFKGGKPYGHAQAEDADEPAIDTPAVTDAEPISRLPESYVPPIIAVLPRMANNESALAEAAKASGTSLERAFEKSVNAAFTVLGYETTLLGHGQGRVPDGVALDLDNLYAIIWDAKMRADGYSIGTDDRTIREYITTQSRDLKRRRSLRNIYFVVVSSSFHDDYDDVVGMVKMETDVSEVRLVEADALVAMVDAKLRDPLQLTLGPDGIQRLFSTSGVLSSRSVREILG